MLISASAQQEEADEDRVRSYLQQRALVCTHLWRFFPLHLPPLSAASARSIALFNLTLASYCAVLGKLSGESY